MLAKVLVKKLNQLATLPAYKQPFDAGCDVCACLDADKFYSIEGAPAALTLGPGQTVLVPTGLAIAIQPGFECQVRTRSGLALKNGIVVANSPGTIDSGYRGEIGVILHNTSNVDFTIHHGDRIAQLVFAPVAEAAFFEQSELPDSKRGTGGFGSTGV